MVKSTEQPVVIIPNLNGGSELLDAVESLTRQTLQPYIIVVDNASTDDSVEKMQQKYPEVELIKQVKNMGYAGGVNPGFRRAIDMSADYAAPFNDDAIADEYWLEKLVNHLDDNPQVGAAACKVLKADGKYLDSTEDTYSHWGLPYPRGRDELDTTQYDSLTTVFGASGAASLYRISALKEVGLLDEDFFAYYEDVDLSFRLQLAGWKISYVPESKVYHQIGMTSGRIKGFTVQQTMRNFPMLTYKNLPRPYIKYVYPRLGLAMSLFLIRAISRGQAVPAFSGLGGFIKLIPKKAKERKHIQANKKVSDEYIWSIMTHDLPPNATALRKLRATYWKLTGKKQ